jgi:hypothetical protein
VSPLYGPQVSSVELCASVFLLYSYNITCLIRYRAHIAGCLSPTWAQNFGHTTVRNNLVRLIPHPPEQVWKVGSTRDFGQKYRPKLCICDWSSGVWTRKPGLNPPNLQYIANVGGTKPFLPGLTRSLGVLRCGTGSRNKADWRELSSSVSETYDSIKYVVIGCILVYSTYILYKPSSET